MEDRDEIPVGITCGGLPHWLRFVGETQEGLDREIEGHKPVKAYLWHPQCQLPDDTEGLRWIEAYCCDCCNEPPERWSRAKLEELAERERRRGRSGFCRFCYGLLQEAHPIAGHQGSLFG